MEPEGNQCCGDKSGVRAVQSSVLGLVGRRTDGPASTAATVASRDLSRLLTLRPRMSLVGMTGHRLARKKKRDQEQHDLNHKRNEEPVIGSLESL